MLKALVTGSAGFIGRHMVKELQGRGWEVRGIDYPTEWQRREGLLPKAYQKVWNDAMVLFRSKLQWQYDLVVHAAYHVGGRAAIDGTNTNFMKNLQLDSSLFEWAIRTKQKRVLYFSSSAAYPVELQSYEARCPLKERYINLDLEGREGAVGIPLDLGPDADYGWAKLTGERLAATARDNGLAVTVVRPFSGYGADQSTEYPFPSIVRRASSGDLTVWGPRGQTRDWIHISDVVKGALAVVESETTDPVNLCTGVGVEMGDLASQVWEKAFGDVDVYRPEVTYDESKPTGVFYRVGDPTRMLKYYKPKISLEEGIIEALDALS